jgi:ABC-type ATPase with predicted acetyltransferase domain
MQITVELVRPTAVTPSPRVLAVAGMFGLGVDRTGELVVIPPTTIDLQPGRVVFVTGASGSGKSSLLQLIAQRVPEAVRFDALPPLPDRPLVDCFAALSLERTLHLLSVAGLSDAFVMLRRPGELSDGQRYRLRLAQAMAVAEDVATRPVVVLADEFGATLDRLTAAVLARNVRKWVSRHGGVCFVAATTHDDLLEPFEPDVLIEKHLDGAIEVLARPTCGGRPSAAAQPTE